MLIIRLVFQEQIEVLIIRLVFQGQIEVLIIRREYEQAFSCALTASDLEVVMYLLKKLPDSAQVFSDPCPLRQPTLLSLIQQLSCGLLVASADSEDIETKLK